jgi:SAM-dependent methyltransferase
MTTGAGQEAEIGASARPPLPVKLIQLTTGTWVSQAISVAARLGVADTLADGPRPTVEITQAVDAHAPTLYRLLRALADLEVVTELEDRRFALTPLGELLRTDADGSMRAWATMIGLPFHRDAWTDMYASVRTGEPAFARVHGAVLFGYLAEHPDDAAAFDTAMGSISTGFESAIVHVYDFGPFGIVVDVGGGRGTLLAAVLQANAEARGVLVDLPDVVAGASKILERAGDFLDTLPDTGDLYLLSNILHDWDDDTAVRILRNCHRAMRDQGRLLIVEAVIPDGTAPSMPSYSTRRCSPSHPADASALPRSTSISWHRPACGSHKPSPPPPDSQPVISRPHLTSDIHERTRHNRDLRRPNRLGALPVHRRQAQRPPWVVLPKEKRSSPPGLRSSTAVSLPARSRLMKVVPITAPPSFGSDRVRNGGGHRRTEHRHEDPSGDNGRRPDWRTHSDQRAAADQGRISAPQPAPPDHRTIPARLVPRRNHRRPTTPGPHQRNDLSCRRSRGVADAGSSRPRKGAGDGAVRVGVRTRSRLASPRLPDGSVGGELDCGPLAARQVHGLVPLNGQRTDLSRILL